MSYGVQVEIWGDYALFSRPEFKVERVSYDIMTPSAARGILESIYWHPGMITPQLGEIWLYENLLFSSIIVSWEMYPLINYLIWFL